jgi:competence protein ComEC
MVAAGLIDDIDILKVSHHGSKHCSTAAFLAAAQPEIAIYCCVTSNTYGHPVAETITRLAMCELQLTAPMSTGLLWWVLVRTTYDVGLTNQVPPVTP